MIRTDLTRKHAGDRTDLTRKHAGESYDSRCHTFDLRSALALGFPPHDFARGLRPSLISATERFQVSFRARSSCVRIAMLPFCPCWGCTLCFPLMGELYALANSIRTSFCAFSRTFSAFKVSTCALRVRTSPSRSLIKLRSCVTAPARSLCAFGSTGNIRDQALFHLD